MCIYIYRLIYLILLINQITCTISHNSLPVFCFIICLEILCRFLATDSSQIPTKLLLGKENHLHIDTNVHSNLNQKGQTRKQDIVRQRLARSYATRLRNWFLIETVFMSTLSELLHTHGIPWFSFLTSTCLGFARGVSASASSFLGMRRKVPPAGPRKRSTHRRLRPMRARKASLDAARYDRYVVPSSKHGIGAMVIHPILGIITMGILTPLDGCMTIPFYEKTKHVLTTAHVLCKVWQDQEDAVDGVVYFVACCRDIVLHEHVTSRNAKAQPEQHLEARQLRSLPHLPHLNATAKWYLSNNASRTQRLMLYTIWAYPGRKIRESRSHLDVQHWSFCPEAICLDRATIVVPWSPPKVPPI